MLAEELKGREFRAEHPLLFRVKVTMAGEQSLTFAIQNDLLGYAVKRPMGPLLLMVARPAEDAPARFTRPVGSLLSMSHALGARRVLRAPATAPFGHGRGGNAVEVDIEVSSTLPLRAGPTQLHLLLQSRSGFRPVVLALMAPIV